jgi:hypothetical protein
MDSLEALGWNEQRADDWQEVIEIAPYLIQGRVVADFGTSLRVAVPEIITAELSGKLAHYSDPQAIPKVGDWVGQCRCRNGFIENGRNSSCGRRK